MIGKTHALVGIKASLGEPLATAPESGIVKVSVEWCVQIEVPFLNSMSPCKALVPSSNNNHV